MNVNLCLQKDLEIPVPRYFMRNKIQLLKDKQKMFTNILETQGTKQKVREETSSHIKVLVRPDLCS